MSDMVAAKQTNITHAEVPDALFPTAQSEKQRDTKHKWEEELASHPPQRQTTSNTKRVTVHPLLQSNIIDGIWRTAPGASLKDIARHSNVQVAQLTKTDNCVHGYLNKCSFSWCNRKHVAATDAEAKRICSMLEKTIKNLEELVKRQGQ
eukprot:2620398-Ditylum_brightwellii.AAC.1